MEKIKQFNKPAANEDFFFEPEPVQTKIIPWVPRKPEPTQYFPKFLFLEAA